MSVSTGNDIVALLATDKERTVRPAFYSRILSADEQALFDPLVFGGLSFDHYIWLLWSIKESVYKYQRRHHPGLVFSPRNIIVRITTSEDFYAGIITYKSQLLYSRSVIRDGVIISVVSADREGKNTLWGYDTIDHAGYTLQSASVRTQAEAHLNAALARTGLTIAKDPAGIPVVQENGRLLDIPISLAHHDRYIAWSFLLPANNS